MKKGGHLGSCLMKDKEKRLLWLNTEIDGKQNHKMNEMLVYSQFIEVKYYIFHLIIEV